MSVVEIKSHDEFLRMLDTKDTLIIIDFTASWCGPCKVIKPTFHSLASQYTMAIFLSVDVDHVQESAQFAQVSAMPTFQFYRNQQKIHEMKGANKQGLEMIVKKLVSTPNVPGASQPEAEATLVKAPPGQMDLKPFIVMNQVECLNTDNETSIKNVFQAGPEGLKSDVDEQLIIRIPFMQPVKVHSIKIEAPESGPKVLKTFVNGTSTLDFDEVDNVPAVEKISLDASDLLSDSKPRNLYFVKYQNVHSLTIFVENNQDGSECTNISKLSLYGTPIEATKDVNELKKMGHDE